MTAIITYAQLKAAGACEDQLMLFKCKFGKSVEVTVELAEGVADEFDWGWAAVNLLRAAAWAEYDHVTEPALAEYERVRAAAWAEYQRATEPALAEYERVRVPAWAEYDHVRATAFATAYINQGGAA